MAIFSDQSFAILIMLGGAYFIYRSLFANMTLGYDGAGTRVYHQNVPNKEQPGKNSNKPKIPTDYFKKSPFTKWKLK